MKYIIMRAEKNGLVREFPIIFPEAIVHADMAKYMTHMFGMHYDMFDAVPVSAGFLSSMDVAGHDTMHGESETLKLKSRPDDGVFTSGLDYNHGMVAA